MNVYDFDGTIYDGDSSVGFYLYCLKTDPRLLRYLPKQIFGFLLYGLKKIDKTAQKECFFCFLQGVSDAEQKVKQFWEKYDHKIFLWYLEKSQTSDIVISASPYFLLKPICDKLSIRELIASDVDVVSGLFRSANCYGTEKVLRFSAQHHREQIEEFYSDSTSDQPMANIAKFAFLVKKGIVQPWKKR